MKYINLFAIIVAKHIQVIQDFGNIQMFAITSMKKKKK